MATPSITAPDEPVRNLNVFPEKGLTDPHVLIDERRLYLYAGHDATWDTERIWTMDRWEMGSTVDLLDWRHESDILPEQTCFGPKSERELYGFLEQSTLSAKDITRLTALSGHEVPDITEHAASLLEIAKIYPHKKKRWRRLLKTHVQLFRRYREAIGLWDDLECADVFGEEGLNAWSDGGAPSHETDPRAHVDEDAGEIPF